MDYWYKATVVKVYDGDTITVDVDLGFDMCFHDVKIRLHGIDTPEIRGEERPEGLVARDRVRELIMSKEVQINTIRDRQGKYGRYLGIVFIPGEDGELININELLVKEGLAEEVDYD